jgi:GNAT superfamily N-acetyltransferase
VNIRTAEIGDAPGIACVHVASWRSAYRGLVSDTILDGLSVSRRTEAWEQILAAARSTTLVGEIDGAVVAFANYGPSRDEDRDPRADAELNALYAAPVHWSRGCGFGLWSEMERRLRPSEFETLGLWVFVGNQRGRRFYERQGCTVDENARRVWRPESDALVEVRYCKSLRSTT